MHFDTLKDWLHWQEGLHPQSIDLGLHRAKKVFHALNPEKKQPITITVAGTNGKGSTIAFLEAIYRAQGFKVGSYTSPHILKYNERIKINNQTVSDEVLCQAFERIEAVRDETSLSYFEFSTLAALDIFSRSNLDIQLLEVGLGGRLDAVNIIDADASIITSICIDHTDWLGDTRTAIAIEKSGVFRPHCPAIVGDIDPPQSLTDCAQKIDAQLLLINQHFSYQKSSQYWTWQSNSKKREQLPLPNLKGEHQFRNASTSLMAVESLQDKISVSDAAIYTGLKNAYVPGRFQLIEAENSAPILLDVSHNPQAAEALLDYLNAEFTDLPVYAIFNMMSDKDMQSVVTLMQNKVQHWYISPVNNPRTNKESDTKEIFQNNHITQISTGFPSFSKTFQTAKKMAENNQGLLVIFGSFFLVSEYLAQANKKQDTSS
ncbi:MAG: bifunctional tetrahydrofolate synthase/dihydrofolate synthase [Methyloprofundus sp.]|nr:bifunctional tetrahydrofolate synthase/dihydrofolate synthase [Methyloprofundus sp.]